MTRRILYALGCAVVFAPAAMAADTELSGRWVSTQYVTFTNPSRAGSAFFLDIDVAKDGSFQGTWDQYSCLSYPGAYGTSTISCSRVKKPAKARGKFSLTAGKGEIELEKLGKGSFTYKLEKDLVLELPKDWLKQGDPVLYTTRLARPKER
jgi:hypothetical protein